MAYDFDLHAHIASAKTTIHGYAERLIHHSGIPYNIASDQETDITAEKWDIDSMIMGSNITMFFVTMKKNKMTFRREFYIANYGTPTWTAGQGPSLYIFWIYIQYLLWFLS